MRRSVLGHRRSGPRRLLKDVHRLNPTARKHTQHRARALACSQRRRDPERPLEPSSTPALHRRARCRRGALPRAAL